MAATLLASGKNATKLLKKDLKRETGYSNADVKRYPFLFAGADKGGITLARFGEMVVEAAREYGVQFDENDATAGIDAALELLGSVGRQGDINDYITNSRIAEAYDYHNTALAAARASMLEAYGMTEGEYEAYMSWLEDAIEQGKSTLSDEEFNQIFNVYEQGQTTDVARGNQEGAETTERTEIAETDVSKNGERGNGENDSGTVAEDPYSFLDEYRKENPYGSSRMAIPEEKMREVADKFIEVYLKEHDGNRDGLVGEMQRKMKIGYNRAKELSEEKSNGVKAIKPATEQPRAAVGEKPTPTKETPKQEPKAEKEETKEPEESGKNIADVEAGGAVVDKLEKMGVEVSADIAENRRVRKQAENDKSENGKVHELRTTDGKVYGFAYRGKLYLDPRKIDAELPLHEYAHLWTEAMRMLNPKKWAEVVEQIKQDKDAWQFIQSTYPDLKTDSEIADEVIATFSGKNGAEKLKAALDRFTQNNPNYTSRWNAIFNSIAKALQDFWKAVGDFLNIKYESAQHIYDQVLKDFVSGMNPRARVEKYLQERETAYMQAAERGDVSKATEIFNQALSEEIGNGMTPFIAVGRYDRASRIPTLAHKVKSRDQKAIDEVAELIAPIIHKNAVLVPAPSHNGKATDMLDLARAIAKRTGSEVSDVLTSEPRDSQYETKKRGGLIASQDMGITMTGTLPDGKIPVVIDNVVGSGNTAEACVRAIGKGLVVSLGDAADRYNHAVSLKSAAPILRDRNNNIVPLSKRFNLGGSQYLGRSAYERADGKAAKVSAKERKLRDAIVGLLRKAGIEVVTDSEEGQRVLDEANGTEKAMRVNGREYAVITHQISTYPKKVERNHVFSDNFYYLCTDIDYENGTFKIIAQLSIAGNEDLINELRKEYAEINLKSLRTPKSVADLVGTIRHRGGWVDRHIPIVEGESNRNGTGELDSVAIRQQADRGADNKRADKLGSDEGWRTKEEIDKELSSKRDRIVELLKNRGFENISTTHSTAHGNSYYIRVISNDYTRELAKIRISDHSVTSNRRVLDEYHVFPSTTPEQVVEDLFGSNSADKYFRTPSGEVYGFVKGGRIYLDPKIATAETPIHEYTHLWAEALRQANPKAWEQLKSELEKDKDLMSYVQRLYPELKGDELMDEVFAHFSGRRGAERLRAEQERMEGETRSIVGKAKVIAMFENLRNALKKFWNAARELFAGNGVKNESAEDFADMVLADLVGGVNPFDEKADSEVRFRGEEEPVFYSNAMRAVENIKQERATPEQWLKMIEKNGGLKAGEDKWLGLSEWLKGSDAKTLTKGEVLEYIRANEIRVEEVSYSDAARMPNEFAYDLRIELEEKASEICYDVTDEYEDEIAEVEDFSDELDEIEDETINEARRRLDEEFGVSTENYISIQFETDSRRLVYEPTGSDDDFNNNFAQNVWNQRKENEDEPINETRLLYTTRGLDNKREIALTVPTIEPWNKHDDVHFGEAGGGRAVAWVRFGETTDADGKRVLVIDEIQSKRHQDGRENGYEIEVDPKDIELEYLNDEYFNDGRKYVKVTWKGIDKGVLQYFSGKDEDNRKYIAKVLSPNSVQNIFPIIL